MSNTPRFAPDVAAALHAAGWAPGRSVELTAWRAALPDFPWHPAAENFLREFLFSLAAWAFAWGPADVALQRLIRGMAARRLSPAR